MAHFVSKTPIHVTVPEYPDEYIAIKPKLTLGDRNRLTGAMIRYQGTTMETHVDAFLQTMLEVAIVDWHLFQRDDEGNVLKDKHENPRLIPYDRKLIYDFDDSDPLIDKVLTEIAERNPTLGAAAPSTQTTSTD